MKRFAIVLSAALVGTGLLPPNAAQASFAGAEHCDVTLAGWPTSSGGSADCEGRAYGSHVSPGVDFTCLLAAIPPGCPFDAHVDAYNETCAPIPQAGPVPPLIGTASGTLNVNGKAEGTFNWARVGLTVVIVPSGAPGSAAGVGAFLPHPPLPTCAAPGVLFATVVAITPTFSCNEARQHQAEGLGRPRFLGIE